MYSTRLPFEPTIYSQVFGKKKTHLPPGWLLWRLHKTKVTLVLLNRLVALHEIKSDVRMFFLKYNVRFILQYKYILTIIWLQLATVWLYKRMLSDYSCKKRSCDEMSLLEKVVLSPFLRRSDYNKKSSN